jgi:hypothetical protein
MSQGDGGLLYSWSTHRVGAYLHALELALPRIDEGRAGQNSLNVSFKHSPTLVS